MTQDILRSSKSWESKSCWFIGRSNPDLLWLTRYPSTFLRVVQTFPLEQDLALHIVSKPRLKSEFEMKKYKKSRTFFTQVQVTA